MASTSNPDVNDYLIAGFGVRIIIKDTSINNTSLLPSFEPFKTGCPPTASMQDTYDKAAGEGADGRLLQFTIDDTLPVVRLKDVERIGSFPTGNGTIVVDHLQNGGYQYIIKDLAERECCLLQTDKDFCQCLCALKGNREMRTFGLNNALILSFAYAACTRQTLLVHASVIRCQERAFPFIAKSGTGKSTHTSLWMKHIPGCDLLNDDMPILRIIDGQPFIYGGPWSGKTPCYRQRRAPLGAITRIDRATSNSIERLGAVEAFASLLPSCTQMKWDKRIYDAVIDNITKVVETTPVYTLHCLPDKEAAMLSHKTLTESRMQ